jgi:adenosylcobinamide-GDP ribazoletransferase
VSTVRAEQARREARAVTRSAALALTFLTVLPLRLTRPAGDLGAAAPWFPAVGALLGAAAGGLLVATEPLLGTQVAATLAIVALVAATGALHVDGLADCADALGARGGERDTRLAIMRDPHTGVFGTLALLAYLLILVGALTALGPAAALPALVIAAATGRWSVLLHAATAPAARPDGLGAAFVVTPAALAAGAVVPVVLALALAQPLHGLAALGAAVAAGLLTSLGARRLVGGRTGDTLGAAVALGELLACLALLACAGR